MSMGSLGSRGAAFLKAALAAAGAGGGKGSSAGASRSSSGLEQGLVPVKGGSAPTGKRKRGRPPNAVINGTSQRRGSLHSKNSITTDSPRSESTKNSDSGSATEEDTCFTLRLVLPCSACGESSVDGSQHESSPSIVVVCCECRKGFHQTCHLPRIPQVFIDDSSRLWRCRSCVPQGSVRKSAKNFRAITRALYQTSLPYSPSKLGWDPEHTHNTNNRYCYCGKDGVWKEKMLQCRTCLQWFHQECVRCLEWPLLRGDLFYNYRCSICTRGPEYLRRLRLSWVDVADLLMYQLHLTQPNKEFFQTRSEIFPYLDSIWSLLQVPHELDACSTEERHSHVLYCLRHVRQRFRPVALGNGEGHGGPAFALIDPQRLPSLSAQHWQVIRQSLRYSQPSVLDKSGSPSRGARSGRSSQMDDEISLSSTITSSSATSIASKTNFDDLFDSLTRPQQRESQEQQQATQTHQTLKHEDDNDGDDDERDEDEDEPDEDRRRCARNNTSVTLGGDDNDDDDDYYSDANEPDHSAVNLEHCQTEANNLKREMILPAEDYECRSRMVDVQREMGDSGDQPEEAEGLDDEPIRNKLRPRTAVQEQKKKRKRRGKKLQTGPDEITPELLDEKVEELVVTASLARIPIPESFSGINNPFYEDPGGTSSLGSFGLLHTEPGPRTTVKKRVLQARDLVITKDGKIRCKRLRRRHSAKLALLNASAAVADISESSNSNSISNPSLNMEASALNSGPDTTIVLETEAGNVEEMTSVFAFKSSMEQQRETPTRSSGRSAALSETGRSITMDMYEGEADGENEHCRRVVAFAGDTSLIKIAFGEAVLASRVLRGGVMELLLRR